MHVIIIYIYMCVYMLINVISRECFLLSGYYLLIKKPVDDNYYVSLYFFFFFFFLTLVIHSIGWMTIVLSRCKKLELLLVRQVQI